MIKRWPCHVMATRRHKTETQSQEVKRQDKTGQSATGNGAGYYLATVTVQCYSGLG
jgi:hypothetical protein